MGTPPVPFPNNDYTIDCTTDNSILHTGKIARKTLKCKKQNVLKRLDVCQSAVVLLSYCHMS